MQKFLMNLNFNIQIHYVLYTDPYQTINQMSV